MKRIRLKYYLRALGVGIVVTTLLMGYSQKAPAQLSDEEIRQRAAQLGMVEQQGVLSELADAARESKEPSQATETEEETVKPQESSQTAGSIESQEQESLQTAEPEETEVFQDGDTVTLVIVRGDTSVSVSRALAEAGLVEDSQTYDRFLCSGGYDKSINPGTYEIPMGATDEEIAQMITKKS